MSSMSITSLALAGHRKNKEDLFSETSLELRLVQEVTPQNHVAEYFGTPDNVIIVREGSSWTYNTSRGSLEIRFDQRGKLSSYNNFLTTSGE